MTLLALAGFAGACDGSPTDPNGFAPGSLRVVIETTGGDTDDDGYVLVIGTSRHSVASSATLVINGLPAGIVTLELDGVAENCTVAGGALRGVAIPAGGVGQTTITVGCVATGVAITTVTSGPEMPPYYSVRVSGHSPQPIAHNGTIQVTRLSPGSYVVTLEDVVDDCSVAGDPVRTVEVEALTVVPVEFAVSCVALTAVVEVTLTTTGVDVDPNGYILRLGTRDTHAPANGRAEIDAVKAGTYTLALADVAPNCVATPGEQHVTATAGGLTRDTVRVRFDLTCQRTQKIAYVQSWARIFVAYYDGSHAFEVAQGSGPAWMPDGRRLLYSDYSCDYYYYYGCGGGLRIVDLETGVKSAVPGGVSGYSPAISPDGRRVAFIRAASQGELVVMNLDGSSALVLSRRHPSTPTWSADGNEIVFACRGEAEATFTDICTINADGSGVLRLMGLRNWNGKPAVSPDGSTIAFHGTAFSSQTEIGLMASDGSGLTRLTSGWSPSWSLDGARIVFARQGGLYVINRDGSGLTQLTSGHHDSPAWRP